MSRRDFLADWLCCHVNQCVTIRESCSARRTGDTVLQVWSYVSLSNRSRRVLLLLECPLLHRAIDLTQIIDASVHLRGCPSPNEVRNRDGCQQTDDGYHNHDLHQCKRCPAAVFDVHTYLSFECDVNPDVDVIMY